MERDGSIGKERSRQANEFLIPKVRAWLDEVRQGEFKDWELGEQMLLLESFVASVLVSHIGPQKITDAGLRFIAGLTHKLLEVDSDFDGSAIDMKEFN